MKVPPVELYGSLLKFAEKGDYDKISKSLPFLDQIFSEAKEKFGVNPGADIRAAIEKDSRSAIVAAIQQAILLDIRDIFTVIRSTAGPSRRLPLRRGSGWPVLTTSSSLRRLRRNRSRPIRISNGLFPAVSLS